MASIHPPSTMEVFARFAQLLASTEGSGQILQLLADVAVERLGASAAVVLELKESGDAHIVAARGLDEGVAHWALRPETFGPELGQQIVEHAGRPDWHAGTLLLVARGDLFGALVLLYEDPRRLDEATLELGEGLANLAAAALVHAYDYEKLSAAYEELKTSRQALLHGEKLRALGQMAASISHDLKNIIAPVIMHLDLLRRKERHEPEMLSKSFEAMDRVLRRGIDTIERLRGFSRQSPSGEREVVDAAALAREALALVEPRTSKAGAGLALETDLEATPPTRVEPSELVNALVNLMFNACDAMPEGGTLRVATGEADGGAFLEVADSGVGMPPEVQERVFEPFFTTKGAEGTGLGLSMVYAFVKRNGGEITLTTAPGEGTSFRLWFPRAEATSAEPAETPRG